MSCTIFYKGTLKDIYDKNSIIPTIEKHTNNLKFKMEIADNRIVLYFIYGNSEPLIFDFTNNKIDSFCKWNNIDDSQEFYKILDLFIELKPFFKSLKIEDDEGIWHSYIIEKKPCKIIRRPLKTHDEIRLSERIANNNEYSSIEQILYDKMYPYKDKGVIPFSNTIMRLIIHDVVKSFGINEFDDKSYTEFIEMAKKNYFYHFIDYGLLNVPDKYIFKDIVLIVWISNCLSYKNKGLVKDIPYDTYGLTSSILAATFGFLSSFLNTLSGIVNSKHAEIDKFMKKVLETDHYEIMNMLNDSSIPERVLVIIKNVIPNFDYIKNKLNDGSNFELELMVSILDYLGFSYRYPD